MKQRLWAAADGMMCLMFVFSLAVQFNDPDPLPWMLVYGAAAVACALSIVGRIRWPIPVLIGVGALIWAAVLSPHVLGRVQFGEMFSAWEMKDVGVEESREMYGLLIVAVWMGVLAVRHARRSAKRAERA